MYDIADVLPDGTISEISSGSSLLIAGPALNGKRDLALDLLAAGHEKEDGLLIITTNKSGVNSIEELKQRVATLDMNRVGIVDCSGSDQQQTIRDIATQQVSSPGDLTGISIATAKLFQQFATQDIASVRHGLVSVTTLLQYLELDTIFKFLHIYTQRITATNGLGIFTIDNAAHDTQTINTITGQFDGVIELRETDAGERKVRIRGLPDAPSGWYPV